MICQPCSVAIKAWNDAIEANTERAVALAEKHLPSRRAQEFFQNRSQNSKKLALHIVVTSLWLQATIRNPLIPKNVGLPLGFIEVALTIGPCFRYMKGPIQKINLLFQQHTKEIASHLQKHLRLKKFTYIITKKEYPMLQPIIGFSLTGCQTSWNVLKGLSSRLKEATKSDVEVLDRDIPDGPDGVARRAIEEINRDILELKRRLGIIDKLLENDVKLRGLCKEALQCYQPIFSTFKKASTEDLDPEDLIDLMAIRSYKKNALERSLEERMVFLQRNPQIAEYVKKILDQQEQHSQKEE